MFSYKKWNQNFRIAFLALIIALFIWAEKALSSADVKKMEAAVIQIEQVCEPVVENLLPPKDPCEYQPCDAKTK